LTKQDSTATLSYMNTKERNEILETLDYKLSTRTLSEQSGIEKRHITEYRKQHGKGRASIYTPHSKPRKMRADPNSIDWSKPKRQIAQETGVSVQRVYQLHKRMLQVRQQCDVEVDP